MINIKYHELEATSAITNYATEKLSSSLKLLNDNSKRLEVELGKVSGHHNNGKIYRVKCVLRKSGPDIHVEVIEDDIYKGIDKLKEKLDLELGEAKDKRNTLFKKGAARIKSLLKFGNN